MATVSRSSLHPASDMAFGRIDLSHPFEQFSAQFFAPRLQSEFCLAAHSTLDIPSEARASLTRSSWSTFPSSIPASMPKVERLAANECFDDTIPFQLPSTDEAVCPITIQVHDKWLRDSQESNSALGHHHQLPTPLASSSLCSPSSSLTDQSGRAPPPISLCPSSFSSSSFLAPTSSSSPSSSFSSLSPSPPLGSSVSFFNPLQKSPSLSSQYIFNSIETDLTSSIPILSSSCPPLSPSVLPKPLFQPQVAMEALSEDLFSSSSMASQALPSAALDGFSSENIESVDRLSSPVLKPSALETACLSNEANTELSFQAATAIEENQSSSLLSTNAKATSFDAPADLSFDAWSDRSLSPLNDTSGLGLYEDSFSSHSEETNGRSSPVEKEGAAPSAALAPFQEESGRHFSHQHFYPHGPYDQHQAYSIQCPQGTPYGHGVDLNASSSWDSKLETDAFNSSFVSEHSNASAPTTSFHDSFSTEHNHLACYNDPASSFPVFDPDFTKIDALSTQPDQESVKLENGPSGVGPDFKAYPDSSLFRPQGPYGFHEPRTFIPTHGLPPVGPGLYPDLPFPHPDVSRNETQGGYPTLRDSAAGNFHHHHYARPGYFTPPPMGLEERLEEAQRSKNEFLVQARQQGLSYREIRLVGNFTEAESTLRGRYRILTKDRQARVRKPVWHKTDINLLCRAVAFFMKLNRNDSLEGVNPSKVPWKKVTEYIASHGGSYSFGYATCKKKWMEMMKERSS